MRYVSVERGQGIEGKEPTGWKWERKEKGERKGRGKEETEGESINGRAEKTESINIWESREKRKEGEEREERSEMIEIIGNKVE